MALTYNKAVRDLSIKALITFNDGTKVNIADHEILHYSIDSQFGFEGLPLGGTEASSFSLEIDNVGRKYTPEQFDNAEIRMFIGLKGDDGEYTYTDFGAWWVDQSSAPEQSVSISLSGCDALASRFAAVYNDTEGAYPTTIGSLAQTICVAAGVKLKSTSFPNAAVQIKKKPKWREETTLRDILSYCAVCAGGYARIDRNGQLEIVGYMDGAQHTITPDLYHAFTPTGGSAFAFNAIEAKLKEDDSEYTRFAVDGTIKANATNTIQVDYNPLLTEAIVNSIVTELTGITMQAGELVWGGDPAVMCSDYFTVETLDGTPYKIMVTAQSFAFDGGLSVTESCNLPTINTTSSASYSTSTNMYDAHGNINATRINGLDSSVINATTGHFENLTATNIEADKLVAALLHALELYAGTISADSIETNVLTATVAQIVQATIDKITAGTITTDELYAAFAEIMSLKVGTLTAESIEADRLAAALANFVVITAGTATFDLATIKHLISEALVLQEGIADSMYITNLAITSANILNATLGNLVIRGEDGNYYRIFVGSDGTIHTEPATVTDDEIAAGQTSTGNQIMETTINTQDLNAQNIRAASALIGEIVTDALYAGKITATEAFLSSATIPTLYTTSIQAIGNSMDLSANNSITLNAGGDGLSKLLRLDEKGVHVGQHGKSHEVLIDDATVNVVMNNRKYSQFASDYVQFGNYQLRLTADGGLAFKMKG